jgi:hypothetical protein
MCLDTSGEDHGSQTGLSTKASILSQDPEKCMCRMPVESCASRSAIYPFQAAWDARPIQPRPAGC